MVRAFVQRSITGVASAYAWIAAVAVQTVLFADGFANVPVIFGCRITWQASTDPWFAAITVHAGLLADRFAG